MLLTFPISKFCRISKYNDALACDLTSLRDEQQWFKRRKQRSAQSSGSSSNNNSGSYKRTTTSTKLAINTTMCM